MKKTISILLCAIIVCGCMGYVFSAERAYAYADGNPSAVSIEDDSVTVSYSDKKTFQNPVANGADPFVFKDKDGTYYMYTTNSSGNGYIAYSSMDLVNWKSHGYVFSHNNVHIEGVTSYNGFWAPEVTLYEGKYYMIVTVNEHLAIAVADSPLGPFETGANAKYIFDFKSIDGHFFHDDDGKTYLYYVNATSGNKIWGCEFSMSTLRAVAGTEKLLISAQKSTGWENSSNHNVAEGPEVFKRNGKYYLIYTCNGYTYKYYAVGVAQSDSPLGTFERQSNNPVLVGSDESGAVGVGHCCYTYSPDDSEMWMVYHKHAGLNKVENREICLDRITFDSKGNVCVSADQTPGKPTMKNAQNYPSGAKSTLRDAVLNGSFAKLAELPVVYVHMNDGNDDATGTLNDPYRTLERAYDAITPDGGSIVLVSSHDISQAKDSSGYLSPEPQIAKTSNYFVTPGDITGPVMLRGINPGIRLRFSYITLSSDHYIDNLTLRPNATAGVIECAFNNVTFGENLSVSPAYMKGEADRYPFIVGGYYQCGRGLASADSYMQNSPYKYWLQDDRPYEYVSTDEDYEITVLGGTWRSIMGGNWRVRSDASVGLIDASVTLTLGGNCRVEPLSSNSSEMNYVVSTTGNSAVSSRGSATLNITGGIYNSPIFVSGRIGSVTQVSGITHASEYHAGDLFCNITGGIFNSTNIAGKFREASLSATMDNINNISGDFTLTIKNGAVFNSASPVFYVTNGSCKVIGKKTAHIANYALPIVSGKGFDKVDFNGNDGPVRIYLSADGSDKNSGLKTTESIATLGLAYKMMQPYGGQIVLLSNKSGAGTNGVYSPLESLGTIKLTAINSLHALSINKYVLSSDHEIDDITLYASDSDAVLDCNQNTVKIGDNVRFGYANGVRSVSLNVDLGGTAYVYSKGFAAYTGDGEIVMPDNIFRAENNADKFILFEGTVKNERGAVLYDGSEKQDETEKDTENSAATTGSTVTLPPIVTDEATAGTDVAPTVTDGQTEFRTQDSGSSFGEGTQRVTDPASDREKDTCFSSEKSDPGETGGSSFCIIIACAFAIAVSVSVIVLIKIKRGK